MTGRLKMKLILFMLYLPQIVGASSCRNDFWGDNCDKPCEVHCRNGCHKATGKCQDCSYGYWGDYCNFVCPNNCRIYCERYYYYYDKIKSFDATSDGCGPYCNMKTGLCGYCQNQRYWGDFCNITCSKVNPGCDTCDGKGTECITCKSRVNCQTPCPLTCKSCSSSKSRCYSCLPGFWGDNCTKTCPSRNCYECKKTDGVCITCKTGYWGSICSFTCAWAHCVNCNINLGLCENCEAGFWGFTCENRCTDGCADRRCEKNTGNCKICKPMFWGALCNLSCIIPNCESISSCSKEKGPTCYKCATGKWGQRCSKNCPTRCTNGCSIAKGECYLIEPTSERSTLIFTTSQTLAVSTNQPQAAQEKNLQQFTGASTEIVIVVGLVAVVVAVLITVLLVKFLLLKNVSKVLLERPRLTTDIPTNSNASAVSDHIYVNHQLDEICLSILDQSEVAKKEKGLKGEPTRSLKVKTKTVANRQGETTINDGLYEPTIFNNNEDTQYESLQK